MKPIQNQISILSPSYFSLGSISYFPKYSSKSMHHFLFIDRRKKIVVTEPGKFSDSP